MRRYVLLFQGLITHKSCMCVYTLAIPRHCFKSIYSLSVEIRKFLKHGMCDCGLIPKFLTCCFDFVNCSSAGQPPNSHNGGLAQGDEFNFYIFLSVFYAL